MLATPPAPETRLKRCPMLSHSRFRQWEIPKRFDFCFHLLDETLGLESATAVFSSRSEIALATPVESAAERAKAATRCD